MSFDEFVEAVVELHTVVGVHPPEVDTGHRDDDVTIDTECIDCCEPLQGDLLELRRSVHGGHGLLEPGVIDDPMRAGGRGLLGFDPLVGQHSDTEQRSEQEREQAQCERESCGSP